MLEEICSDLIIPEVIYFSIVLLSNSFDMYKRFLNKQVVNDKLHCFHGVLKCVSMELQIGYSEAN